MFFAPSLPTPVWHCIKVQFQFYLLSINISGFLFCIGNFWTIGQCCCISDHLIPRYKTITPIKARDYLFRAVHEYKTSSWIIQHLLDFTGDGWCATVMRYVDQSKLWLRNGKLAILWWLVQSISLGWSLLTGLAFYRFSQLGDISCLTELMAT